MFQSPPTSGLLITVVLSYWDYKTNAIKRIQKTIKDLRKFNMLMREHYNSRLCRTAMDF